MANREEQLKQITEQLEQGVAEIFTSEKYTEYLNTMAKFHNYSFNKYPADCYAETRSNTGSGVPGMAEEI